MRILRVAQKVYPDVKGGGPYHVHALSRDQAEMGHDVTVLTVGDGPRREERDGYTLVRRPALVEPLGNAISPGVARYLRRAGEFDVIHAHSHLYCSTNFAALACRLGETPLAITNHGLYSQTAPEWLFGAYLRTFGQWTFNEADVVFCYTPEEHEALRDIGVESPIDVIPNGIDLRRFTPDGPGCDHIATDELSILFVGRLVEGKRPGTVIESLNQVHNMHPRAKLYVVGQGKLEAELQQLVASYQLEANVEFLGQIPYDEMPRVYRSADVFVLPSRAEGLPRTILESLASETPVVTSALPQLESIANVGGCTVKSSNPTAFADAIAGILSDEDHRAKLGRQGRQLVLDEFTWDVLVSRTTQRLIAL